MGLLARTRSPNHLRRLSTSPANALARGACTKQSRGQSTGDDRSPRPASQPARRNPYLQGAPARLAGTDGSPATGGRAAYTELRARECEGCAGDGPDPALQVKETPGPLPVGARPYTRTRPLRQVTGQGTDSPEPTARPAEDQPRRPETDGAPQEDRARLTIPHAEPDRGCREWHHLRNSPGKWRRDGRRPT